MPRTKMDFSSILSRLNGSVWYIRPEALDLMMSILDKRISGQVTDHDELRMLLHAADLEHDRQHGDGSVMRGVGILPVYGPIFPKANMMTEMSGATSMESFKNDFNLLMSNDYVSTILLDFDTPGGNADMVPEMAQLIREARDVKPIIAVANTAMNSAGYYLGSQASKVYATPSAQVGSVGVISMHRDESRANEMKGIKDTFTYAGKYKSEGYEPLTPDAKAHLQHFVDQHYAQFVSDVAAGRNTTTEDVEANYGQGRVFSPQDALDVGMIDGIVSFDQVLGRLIESGGDIRGIEAPPVSVSAHGRITTKASYDADKEHSEPGTGLGGEPPPSSAHGGRYPEDGDPMITNGWRRVTPDRPADEDEYADALRREASAVNRQWLEDRARALGVDFNSELSDDDLAAAIADEMDQIVVPLSNATADAQKQQDWALAYPEQAAQLRELLEKDKRNDASKFADAYRTLPDDGTKGFSMLVREKLHDAHLAITERSFTHDQLKELVDVMSAKAATVPIGEMGSSREGETDEKEGVQPSRDFRRDRQKFAELVRDAMTEDGMTREAAFAHVAQMNPELAEAYASGHVGGGS